MGFSGGTALRTTFRRIGEMILESITGMIDIGFRDDLCVLVDDELVIRGST